MGPFKILTVYTRVMLYLCQGLFYFREIFFAIAKLAMSFNIFNGSQADVCTVKERFKILPVSPKVKVYFWDAVDKLRSPFQGKIRFCGRLVAITCNTIFFISILKLFPQQRSFLLKPAIHKHFFTAILKYLLGVFFY